MVPDFDLWPRQWQNGPHSAGKSYSTLGEFYPNRRLESKPLKAFYKGFYTAKKLVQEPEEEQEVWNRKRSWRSAKSHPPSIRPQKTK